MKKVSICTVTYNHELYLAQTIESVLMQKTDFTIEMVIGEDCSTDNTREILRSYAEKYPDIIKPIYHAHNVGPNNNSLACLAACTGEYIAALEGDDYWIDPLKLQRQIDFLDSHPDYAMCFTQVYEEMNGKRIVSPLNPWSEPRTFSILELSQGNIIHTPSVVFRGHLLRDFPDWFGTSPIGDYVIHMLNARHGLIRYMPDITAVYRRFTGMWSTKPMTYQYEVFNKSIDLLLREDFSPDVRAGLIAQKNLHVSELLKLLLRDNNPAYIDKMRAHLQELGIESEFVSNWMLHVYPERIKLVQSAWPYRFYQYINASIARLRGVLGKGKRSIQRMLKK